MKHTKPHCRICDAELTDDNWYPSRSGKGNSKRTKEYKCIPCFDYVRIKNRIKKGERSPSLIAKFFGSKHKSEYNSVKEGDVYIIINPAWEGWIKVGMALDAHDRLKSYQTSSPLRDYKLKYKKYFKDRKKAEHTAHNLLDKESLDRNGEWFRITQIKARGIIESI